MRSLFTSKKCKLARLFGPLCTRPSNCIMTRQHEHVQLGVTIRQIIIIKLLSHMLQEEK